MRRSNEPQKGDSAFGLSGGTGKVVSYAPSYSGNSTDPDAATVVNLSPGMEARADVGIQLVTNSTVTGTVTDQSGRPMSAVQVFLFGAAGVGDDIRGRMTTRVGPDGTFSFSAVAPGHYLLVGQSTSGGGLWSISDLVLVGNDVSGVAVRLEPGVAVEGRLVIDSVSGAPLDPARVRVSLSAIGPSAGLALISSAVQVKPDRTFSITGVPPGVFKLGATVSGAGTWTLSSFIRGDVDLFDTPLTVDRGGVPDLVLTATDMPTRLSGTLTDASSRTSPGLLIAVFPVDRNLWTPENRRIRLVRTSTNGTYEFVGLPAGQYCVAGITDATLEDLADERFLELLVAGAATVALTPHERRVLDLRIGGGERQRRH